MRDYMAGMSIAFIICALHALLFEQPHLIFYVGGATVTFIFSFLHP